MLVISTIYSEKRSLGSLFHLLGRGYPTGIPLLPMEYNIKEDYSARNGDFLYPYLGISRIVLFFLLLLLDRTISNPVSTVSKRVNSQLLCH